MGKVNRNEITKYVQQNIESFHAARLQSLKTLRLKKIIQRKNPYLFKAKYVISGPELVKAFLDAHLSSQEEGIFGTFLEGLARFVCEKAFRGYKSSAVGIDLEVIKGGVTYIIAIKSGPNWGNSRQISKMMDDFRTAKRVLGTNRTGQSVVAINGCCYGREPNPDRGDYLKLCGQAFWEFVSGDPNFYIEIVEPIGHQAEERNEAFAEEYTKVFKTFSDEFTRDYCSDGLILWDRILKMNSAVPTPKITKSKTVQKKRGKR